MKCSHSNDVAPLALGESYIPIFHHLETKKIRDLLVTEAFTELYRRKVYNAFKVHRFVWLIIRNKEMFSK